MAGRRGSVIGVAVAAVLSAALGGSPALASAASAGPRAIEADDFAVSVAVRSLNRSQPSPSAGSNPPRVNPLALEPDAGLGASGSAAAPDPLALSSRRAGGRTPTPSQVFDGTSNPAACSGCTPPDTTGDVGPSHYIQMVNATKVAIYNKTGTLLTPAFNLSTLFTSGPCSTGNAGDPQVLYDELADRWLLSQFTLSNQLCFAISQTSDPLGAYFTYSFTTPNFPDYFKVGVWPTGYYVSTNEPPDYTAYALDRTKMLAGDPTASMIRFPGQTNFLMPADVDGPTAPTPQGGLFYTFKDNVFHGGADRLEVFQLTPDFATPASSTFSNIATIPITSFTYTVCGFFVLDCIPQPGTAEGLDPVSEWPMQRLAYRGFADHEALVGNFTVDVGSDRAGIRWFELRNTGAGYTLFQEGTHAPADTLNRWMGSIAIDGDGNIALGYSVSSSTLFPSIRYATRTPSDPPGTLQAEQTLQAGAGSQTSTANRWGDYSAMSVDPASDCDFWYTNEYYSATSSTTWRTSIGTFKEPSCPLPPPQPPPPSPSPPPPSPSPPPPSPSPAQPSNVFTIDKVELNKKKGTATLRVTVPGPGELTLGGSGVRPQRPAFADDAGARPKPVAAGGTASLKIKATGNKKKKLRKKGKVKVKASVTFTPTGGTAATTTKPVKLKKKLKR